MSKWVNKRKRTQRSEYRLIFLVVGFIAGIALMSVALRASGVNAFIALLGSMVLMALGLFGFFVDVSRSIEQKPVLSHPDSQILLMDTFDFNLDELEANQQGYIAESQRSKLYAKRWNPVGEYLLIFVASILFGGIIIVSSAQTGTISLVAVVPTGCMVAGAIIWVIFGVYTDQRRFITDSLNNDLKSISGYVEVIPSIRNSRKRLYSPPKIKIGGQKFVTPELPQDIFVKSDAYRIFYTPRSMSILSIEHLGRRAE